RLVVAARVRLPVERHPDQRRMPRLDCAVDRVRRDALAGLGNRRTEVNGGSPHGCPVDAVARLLDLTSVGIAHEAHIRVAAARLARPVMNQVDADLIEDLLFGGGMGVVGQHHRERGLLAGQVVLLVIPRHVDRDRRRSRGRRRRRGGRGCWGMRRRGSRPGWGGGCPGRWGPRGGCRRVRRGGGRWGAGVRGDAPARQPAWVVGRLPGALGPAWVLQSDSAWPWALGTGRGLEWRWESHLGEAWAAVRPLLRRQRWKCAAGAATT